MVFCERARAWPKVGAFRAIGFLLMLWSLLAWTTPPVFVEKAPELGLDLEHDGCITAGWMDLDLDGVEEPIWVAATGIRYLDSDEDGTLVLKNATVSGEGLSTLSIDTRPILAWGDFDRDGYIELLIAAERLMLYRLVSAATFEEVVDIPLPVLPSTMMPADAAVGDLNADGWPDVVLATGSYEMGHFYMPGAVDLVLMNRYGLFELSPLEPARASHTHGLTLVDMNGDGRLDIVESVDFSGLVGGSRILLNQTLPGALTPIFEIGTSTYDQHSYGMGAAVDDIDADGDFDIYNSSTGRDLLLYQADDGTMEDRTLDKGIHHLMGNEAVRVQWAPSLADFNGDGRLDIFVRHDHRLILASPIANLIDTDPLFPTPQLSLIYAQKEDGSFERAAVPFDPSEYSGGVDATVGDVNSDGRLDIAMGSLTTLAYATIKAKASFWLNETLLTEGTHALRVALAPSVSANPPVGAAITASCSGVSQVRHVITGGKVGGVVGTHQTFSWPSCEGAIDVEVRWPSGARTTHSVPKGTSSFLAEEPEWWSMVLSEGAWNVHLAPEAIKSGEACAHDSVNDTWECCVEACQLSADPLGASLDWVRAGQVGTEIALPARPYHYLLATDPTLPKPDEPIQIKVRRVHPLGDLGGDNTPWLRVKDVKVPWDVSEPELGQFEVQLQAAAAGEALDLSVFVNTTMVAGEAIPSGIALDPRKAALALFPSQDPSGIGMWRLAVNPRAHANLTVLKSLKMLLSNGDPVLSDASFGGTGRAFIDVDWADIPPGLGLVLMDGDVPRSDVLKAHHTAAPEDMLERISSIHGYISRTKIVENGDGTVLYFTLLDEDGNVLPPVPETVRAETDGLRIIGGIMRISEPYWDLQLALRSEKGVGPAKVRILRDDGLLLGEWTVERRASLNLDYSAADSTISLSHDSLPGGVGASTRLHLYIRNQWGEFLGLDVNIRVEAHGALCVFDPVVESDGHVSVPIETGYFGGEWPLDVFINDQFLASTVLEVVGPALPENPAVATAAPSADTSDDDPSGAELGGGRTPEPDGCASSSGPRSFPWLMLLGLMIMIGLRDRSRGRKR